MEHSINHPKHGELLSSKAASKYLGIPRGKFRRIAPPPCYKEDGIYSYWSRRVLDILPTSEEWSYDETRRQGVACGRYLIGSMSDDQIADLRSELRALANQPFGCQGKADQDTIDGVVCVLGEHGVQMAFRHPREAEVFRMGVLEAINKHYEPVQGSDQVRSRAASQPEPASMSRVALIDAGDKAPQPATEQPTDDHWEAIWDSAEHTWRHPKTAEPYDQDTDNGAHLPMLCGLDAGDFELSDEEARKKGIKPRGYYKRLADYIGIPRGPTW